MIIISTSPEFCSNKKIALSFLNKEAFIEAMQKLSECQDDYHSMHEVSQAVDYFEEALHMFNTHIITEKTYKTKQGEWHETIEQAAYGLGWQD